MYSLNSPSYYIRYPSPLQTLVKKKQQLLQQTNAIGERMWGDIMRFQGVFLVECLLAQFALERLLRRMRALVRVQSGGEREPFAAHVTLVWPLTRMPIDVRLQVALLVEALATVFTFVHAHIGVGPHVIRQVGQLLEPAPAFLAFVRLLTSVCVPVDLHVNLLVKSLPAKVAHKRLVVGVRAHVRVQVGRTVERLVALRAYVRFDRRVRQTVTRQISRLAERASALLALERFVAGMDTLVRRQRIGTAERFATNVAGVAVLSAVCGRRSSGDAMHGWSENAVAGTRLTVRYWNHRNRARTLARASWTWTAILAAVHHPEIIREFLGTARSRRRDGLVAHRTFGCGKAQHFRLENCIIKATGVWIAVAKIIRRITVQRVLQQSLFRQSTFLEDVACISGNFFVEIKTCFSRSVKWCDTQKLAAINSTGQRTMFEKLLYRSRCQGGWGQRALVAWQRGD